MEAVRYTLRYLITKPFIKSRTALIMRLLRKDCSLSFRSYAHTHTCTSKRQQQMIKGIKHKCSLIWDFSFSSSQDVANFAFHVDTFATQFFKYIMISFETGGVKRTKRFVWQTWPCWETNSCVKVNSSPLLSVHSRISGTCVPSFTLYINRNTIMSIWMPKGLNTIQRLI